MGEEIDVDHICLPPKYILFIEGDFFCRNNPKGGSREVERSFVLLSFQPRFSLCWMIFVIAH